MEHVDRKINSNETLEKKTMKINEENKIEDILKFISTTENIITNLYHCYYWSILLGKKVVITNKWSTKFNKIFPTNLNYYNKNAPLTLQFNMKSLDI